MMKDSFLAGKTVLLTREESENLKFASLIEEQGGIPCSIPLIGFRPAQLDETASAKLAKVKQYDWVIFTSKNGVEYFFRHSDAKELPNIAVIGSKTERAIQKFGFIPRFVPSRFVAECFVEEFVPLLKRTESVLVVKGNLARNLIAEAIIASGHICDEVIIYENSMPEGSEERLGAALKREAPDVITFTSSSAVQHFMEVAEKHSLRPYFSKSVIACIGPIAKKTAEQYGLNVNVCAEPYTMEGLVTALSAYRGS